MIPALVSRVIDACATEWGVTREDILGRCRRKRFAHPRIAAQALARKHTDLSYPELGDIFDRDHASIMNARARVLTLCMEQTGFLERMDAAEKSALATVEVPAPGDLVGQRKWRDRYGSCPTCGEPRSAA